jgi:hypothetical protein
MFKGVSQCMPTVDLLYFGPFNPFHYSSLTSLSPTPPIFEQLSIHILISSTFTDLMFYNITDALSFSFPFPFPKFNRVVPLFQTYSTYEFVYDHTCFCVYVYLLYLFSMNERKHVFFVFLGLAYFT